MLQSMQGLPVSAHAAIPGTPALRLSGFGVCFGRKIVLSHLDLELPPNGISVLMGPVKTGKSTLLRTLAGLNATQSTFRCWGQGEMLGRPLADDWKASLFTQHAQLLTGTVGDALVHHLRQRGTFAPLALKEFAQQALIDFGLTRYAATPAAPMLDLPTAAQRAVSILSLAQVENRLLLIDEPTYGLAEREAEWLIDWLAALGKQRRLFVTLHHQQQARRLGQYIVLIGGGRVLASAPADQFFERPPNTWAEQFVRTGSLDIASPDASPEDLSADVDPPPPLSDAAREAIAAFESPPHQGVEMGAPATATATTRPTPFSPVPTTPAATAVSIHSMTRQSRTFAPLPPVSARGVEDAAMVGRSVVAESRGPAGFHWIVPGRLAGCPEPGVTYPIEHDLSLLNGVGITTLVTLTERDLDQNALDQVGMKNLHLPIRDREPPTLAQAYMLIRRMQLLLDRGEALAVHCKAGIGRTGTILGCWLIREGGLTAEDAISRLRRIEPAYVQTSAQENFLAVFEADILKRI